jgi:hypothetical protein
MEFSDHFQHIGNPINAGYDTIYHRPLFTVFFVYCFPAVYRGTIEKGNRYSRFMGVAT